MIGIYKITSPKGKVYIGECKDISYRSYLYSKYLCPKQTKLHRSLKKHGWESHKFEVIEECKFDDLLERERFWQDHYNVLDPQKGLNCMLTKVSNKKQVLSDSTKRKIGVANKGKTAWNKGKEYLQIKGENHVFYGIKKPEFAESQRGSKNKMYGKIAINAKKVLNKVTGETFSSCKEASDFYKVKFSTLRCKLNGSRKNNTDLVYL